MTNKEAAKRIEKLDLVGLIDTFAISESSKEALKIACENLKKSVDK